MFDKQRNKQANPKAEEDNTLEPPVSVQSAPTNNRRNAVIGSTITIKGEVSGDEDLIIEGKVEGTVQLPSNTVTVGATGKLQANIDAKVVQIDGEVHGDVTGGEKVVISKAGRVRGNIVAPRVTLEDGAQFKGSIDMDPGAAATELPLSSASSASKAQRVPEQTSATLSSASSSSAKSAG